MALMQHHIHEVAFFERKSVRVFLSLLVGIFALSVARAGVSVWLLSQERERLASELTSVQARANERSAQLEGLSTPAGVEKALRSAFNIKKPDEQTIVILDPTPTTLPEQKNSSTWWENIKKWLTQK